MPERELVQRINRLKAEKGAVILAHNYQPPEIQDLADHLGDSLDLGRLAHSLDNGIVILKAKHPGAAVVMYVNSPVSVKAQSDICCTSANALDVISTIPADRKIIFGPDKHLGAWVSSTTGREMILWQGYCPVHQKFSVQRIRELKVENPGAEVIVHPEVNPSISAEADAVLGTNGMIRYAGRSETDAFIVGTEKEMCYRLQNEYPAKRFIPASGSAICKNMKKNTLEKVLNSLENLEPVITVDETTASKARHAIERMIEIG